MWRKPGLPPRTAPDSVTSLTSEAPSLVEWRGLTNLLKMVPYASCFSKSRKDLSRLRFKDATSTNPAKVLFRCLGSFQFYQGFLHLENFQGCYWSILCVLKPHYPMSTYQSLFSLKVVWHLWVGPFQWCTSAHSLDWSIICFLNARKDSCLASKGPDLEGVILNFEKQLPKQLKHFLLTRHLQSERLLLCVINMPANQDVNSVLWGNKNTQSEAVSNKLCSHVYNHRPTHTHTMKSPGEFGACFASRDGFSRTTHRAELSTWEFLVQSEVEI